MKLTLLNKGKETPIEINPAAVTFISQNDTGETIVGVHGRNKEWIVKEPYEEVASNWKHLSFYNPPMRG